MNQKLYEWQDECLNKWFANHGRGMVQAVTGSGKTLLALTAAKQLDAALQQKLRVKIVVPTGALLRQWYSALTEFLALPGEENNVVNFRKKIGLRGCGNQDPKDRKYMIYIINSARYELARQILSELRNGFAVFLIADECHHYVSGQNQLIFEFLPYIKPYEEQFFSLGLSATLPHGQSLACLSEALGQKIYTYKLNHALEKQTVCQYDIYHISLPFQRDEQIAYEDLTEQMRGLYRWLLQRHSYLKDATKKEKFELLKSLAASKDPKTARNASLYMQLTYKRKGIVNLASSRIACALDLIERLDRNEKIIIFGERIQQSEELYVRLQKKYPEKAGRYHSQMGMQANRNTLERFQTGDIRILIACKAIDEGVDVPDASIGIVLSSTSMQRQRIQRLGRIIRKKEGKKRASLYYLHIEETTEEICFLPDTNNSRIFELEYSMDEHEFYHRKYFRIAAKLCWDMQQKGMAKEKLAEIVRCLRLGSVRADWIAEENEIAAQIESAKNLQEKNYWICMKKMSRIYHDSLIHVAQRNDLQEL